jgi:hypothetical protein
MADTYNFKGCQFEISYEDGWYYVNYVGKKARSWGAATGMARHYAITQV